MKINGFLNKEWLLREVVKGEAQVLRMGEAAKAEVKRLGSGEVNQPSVTCAEVFFLKRVFLKTVPVHTIGILYTLKSSHPYASACRLSGNVKNMPKQNVA